jgi:hypothetical protein
MGLLDKMREKVQKVADDIAGDPGQESEATATTEVVAVEPSARGREAPEAVEPDEPESAPSGRDSM